MLNFLTNRNNRNTTKNIFNLVLDDSSKFEQLFVNAKLHSEGSNSPAELEAFRTELLQNIGVKEQNETEKGLTNNLNSARAEASKNKSSEQLLKEGVDLAIECLKNPSEFAKKNPEKSINVSGMEFLALKLRNKVITEESLNKLRMEYLSNSGISSTIGQLQEIIGDFHNEGASDNYNE